MGRRKKCEQIKRTNNVMVRFTDAEYASISISAEQAGYPVAVYVRKSALDERIEVHYNITAELPELQKLIAEYFDKPLILINRQLDKQTKQMVCGYALGHYLEHQLLMDLHTLNKFLTIKDKHILLYEHNAFTSHLMLDSDEVYQMTKRGLDAAQISVAKRIHLNLVMVKLLELHHLGYDLRHYHAQHHAFIKQFNLPAHFQFDVAAG